MKSLLSIIVLPVFLLNSFGGIVAYIWLIVLGRFWVVISTILLLLFSSFIFPLLFGLIHVPFLFLIRKFHKKGNYFLHISSAITNFIIILIPILWTIFVLDYHIPTTTEYHHITSNPIPYILLGYSTAVFPFSYLASKETTPDSAGILLSFFTVIGTLLIFIMLPFTTFQLETIFQLYIGVMFICWVILVVRSIKTINFMEETLGEEEIKEELKIF